MQTIYSLVLPMNSKTECFVLSLRKIHTFRNVYNVDIHFFSLLLHLLLAIFSKHAVFLGFARYFSSCFLFSRYFLVKLSRFSSFLHFLALSRFLLSIFHSFPLDRKTLLSVCVLFLVYRFRSIGLFSSRSTQSIFLSLFPPTSEKVSLIHLLNFKKGFSCSLRQPKKNSLAHSLKFNKLPTAQCAPCRTE